MPTQQESNSSILAELYKYNPSALIELYELDLTPLQEYYSLKGFPIATTKYYFHNGYSKLFGTTTPEVIWGNPEVTYLARPIQMDGIQVSSAGEIPRPSLTVSNQDLFFSALSKAYSKLVGAKITRIRTFVKFLNEANFKKNLVTNSEYNATYWTLPLGGATLTGNQSDPLGGTGAVRLTNGNSTPAILRVNLPNGIVANGTDTYTFSFYVKRISGNGTPIADLNDGTSFNYSSKLITGQWVRVSWSGIPSAGTKTFFDLQSDSVNNLVMDFFGIQIEKNSVVTEYQKVGTTWNPTADPNAKFPDDVYFIDRVSEEIPGQMTFELAPAWDIEGIMLPRRQVVANICPWTYKKSPCNWSVKGIVAGTVGGTASATTGTYNYVTTTGGTGTGAKLKVVINTGSQLYSTGSTVTVATPGTGYSIGDVLTVAGTSLGGTTSNNLTFTLTAITAPNYYDANDLVVTDAAQDQCGKRFTSCKIRFGSRTLPFGGFPSAGLYGKPI